MLCRTILTLLIASIVISRIEAREIGERRAQLNKTPVDTVTTVVEALAVQDDNTFNTGLNDKSIYGLVVKVEDTMYESPDSRQPISTQTRTGVVAGGPAHDGVSYAKSEERDQQGQPKNNNVYRSRDDNNQTQPNEKHKSSNRGIAKAIITNSFVQTSGNMQINIGSSITRNGHVYAYDDGSQSGDRTINGTEERDELLDASMDFIKQMEALYKNNEESNNRLYSGNQSDTQQDPTGSKPNSSYIFLYSDPNLQTEENAEDTKEKEASAEKHNRPNGQPSFSPNVSS